MTLTNGLPVTMEPYGDAAMLINIGEDAFDPGVNRAVQALSRALRASGVWDEVVAGYDSVLVTFDPLKVRLETAEAQITNLFETLDPQQGVEGRFVDIPVVYGGVHGPDIQTISERSGLSEAEIIALHTGQDYDVVMTGFIPGFAFLSEAPEALHHPRHAEPRAQVAAGSVGLAGRQTGIYGLQSPGGWQIIGRTPLKMFDKNRPEPFLVKAGDRVRFVAVSEGDFDD